MNKVQLISKCLKLIFATCVILLPLLQVAFWSYADQTLIQNASGQVLAYGIPLPSLEVPVAEIKFLCFLISMVPIGITMAVFFLLSKLFSLYSKGIIFELSNVTLIKKIAYLLLIKAVIGPIYEAAITAAWTMNNPVGERMVRITTQTINLTEIITVLTVFVIAWVMGEGHKLQLEQQFTV